MTTVDVVYRYGVAPGPNEARALDRVREVYGIRRLSFDEQNHTLRVEYDATRLSEATVASLLRKAGLDLGETLQLV